MQLEPDDLAAAATDRDALSVLPADPDDRADLAAYRRVVVTGRSLTRDDVATDDPPAGLWDRIAASIADDAVSPAAPHPVPAPASGADDNVVSLDSRRRTWKILAAAAAVVVLALGVVAVVNRSSGSGTELVASTDLSLLEGGGSGSAELVKRSDGMHLVVDVAGLSPAERADFFELWLLTPDGKDPQSLTKFNKDGGTIDVAIPPGMSTTKFPVVDISEEVDDGNESHSGKSILRGSLA
jgi:anti-sigma-K factor RskA